MPKERLLLCQGEDRAKGLTEHHLQQLKVYFTQCASAQHSGCARAHARRPAPPLLGSRLALCRLRAHLP
jgi:hypothetical protein